MHGRCLCGAVSFEAEPPKPAMHACHCEMCRRWTGSALLAVMVPADALRLTGEEHVRRLQSSDWAERAWCDRCGSGLWYRVTAEGPAQGQYHMPAGLFDEPDRFELRSEIYIDRKPAGYAFAGERKRLTKAEVEAEFGGGGS